MKNLKYTLPMMILLLSFPLLVQAQPGRNEDRTPIVPHSTIQVPDVVLTLPAVIEDFEVPEDWSDFTLPTELPSQEDIQAMIENLDLPYTIDDLNLPESSVESYAAIVGFGQTYLGVTVSPLYAGMLTGDLPATDIELDIPAEIQAISSELPAEITSIVNAMSGVAYWGIYETGAAAVYTASDCAVNCSVTMDNLQLTLTTGSLGLYSVYSDAPVTDALSAQNLVMATYPALNGYAITPYDAEVGYAFTGMNTTMGSDFSGQGFVAGVTTAETGQSIVYVIFAVGDGYVSLLLD